MSGQTCDSGAAKAKPDGELYPTAPTTNQPTPSQQFDTSKVNMRQQIQLMMAQKQVRCGGLGVPSGRPDCIADRMTVACSLHEREVEGLVRTRALGASRRQ